MHGQDRAIVVEEVYDEFIEELKGATEAMKVGDPLEEDTDIGPVVNKSQYESILEALETARNEGRVVLDGGATGSEDEGYYISPSIVADVDNRSETAQEEIFGPVLAVIKARDFDDAVGLANDTRYGLTAGIATRSLRYAHEFMRRSETGLVNVNLPTAGLEFQVPFGEATKKSASEEGSRGRRPWTSTRRGRPSPHHAAVGGVSVRARGYTHVSVSATDLDESVRFYTDFFGMEEVPSPTSPARALVAGG